jgi:hypothetical protein
MTGEEEGEEEIFQFLAGNWYSRPENDLEIVEEIVDKYPSDKLRQQISCLRRFMAGPRSTPSKSAFIRRSVQRHIANKPADAPLVWLNRILFLLEKSLAQKSNKNPSL